MYYLTYYEEYPIYEAAEGGYYYSGKEAVEWAYSEDKKEIVDYIPTYAEEHDLELVKFNTDVFEYLIENIEEEHDSIIVAIEHSKYIGEERYICIEYSEGFKSRNEGWHPYE